MKNFVLLLSLLIPAFAQATVSLPQTTLPTYQPKAYSATYSVFRNGAELGTATVKFSALDNGRWALTSNTIGTGIAAIAGVEINERSMLRWNEGKPETIDYHFTQKTAWKSKQRSIKVDAQNKLVDSQDNDKRFSLNYVPGILDRHAVTIAVMQDLSQGKRDDLTYPVADRDDFQIQRYRIMDNEKLDTALGVLNSVKVQRIRDDANGKNTTLWLGTDKQFIPLCIEQKESNGDVISMQIKSLR